MWTELPNDRASTPIKKRCSYSGPRTSTPKLSISKNLIHRTRKKKKQKLNNDYHRLLFYGQQKKIIHKKKHSTLQVWFL